MNSLQEIHEVLNTMRLIIADDEKDSSDDKYRQIFNTEMKDCITQIEFLTNSIAEELKIKKVKLIHIPNNPN